MAANVLKIVLFAAGVGAATATNFPDYEEGTLKERGSAWRQLVLRLVTLCPCFGQSCIQNLAPQVSPRVAR